MFPAPFGLFSLFRPHHCEFFSWLVLGVRENRDILMLMSKHGQGMYLQGQKQKGNKCHREQPLSERESCHRENLLRLLLTPRPPYFWPAILRAGENHTGQPECGHEGSSVLGSPWKLQIHESSRLLNIVVSSLSHVFAFCFNLDPRYKQKTSGTMYNFSDIFLFSRLGFSVALDCPGTSSCKPV